MREKFKKLPFDNDNFRKNKFKLLPGACNYHSNQNIAPSSPFPHKTANLFISLKELTATENMSPEKSLGTNLFQQNFTN